MNETEIEILVLEAQAGSKGAFAKLYEHFLLPMRKFAYLRVHDSMIADDLVQNVWLKVSRRMLRLNDVSLFRSWLYKALRWEIIDWFRKSNKELSFENHDWELASTTSNNESYEIIRILGALDSMEREVAELYYLNDLCIREIALTLDIAEGTVKSRLHRARAQLKQKLNIQELE